MALSFKLRFYPILGIKHKLTHIFILHLVMHLTFCVES